MAILSVHVSGQERARKWGKTLVPGPLPVRSLTESRRAPGDPVDCSPPDSSVHGILQARMLEWSCHFLLRGIFQTQGFNQHFLCLLNRQADSLPLASSGNPLSTCYASKTSAWNMMFTIGFGGFSCSSAGKEPAPNEGDPGSLTGPSWVRKILWRRDRLPSPVSLGFPGGSDGRESAGNSGDLGSIPGFMKSQTQVF